MRASLTQVKRFGTGGNGQTVASANCHVFRVGLQCCVELQSPSDVFMGEQISEKKCGLLGQSDRFGDSGFDYAGTLQCS